jgi:hypothetical protein
MALTPQQIFTKYESIFANNTTGEISEADLREFSKDLTDYLGAANVDDIIPTWTAGLTFQTDGSDSGDLCRHTDASGAIRLWQTKTDDNINNEPPTDPGTTEDTNWLEVSASSNSAFVEWSAGVYGSGLIIVFYSDSFYKLNVASRPYISADIVAETSAGDWIVISGGSGSGGSGTGVFEPVQDITELKALNTTDGAVWKDKWAILVEDEGQFYRLDRESAVSEALPQIVAPTTGVGRWIQDQKVQLDAKADKAVPTFSGNLAQLDSTGNLQDTGEQADFIDIYNDVAAATKTFLNNNENWLSGTTVLDQVTVEGKAGFRYKGTDFFFECINQDTWVRFPTDAQYFNPLNIPSTEKTKLENTGNWTAKVYTGTAIVNCPIGSEHYDANYYFKFVDNNTPIRIARI